ncbi:hypothetical protein C8034_v000603 [Colletotrichum sidae]|uniref:Uncharacterized protein n=1 Tax=Colletotrichum sidae TaxID=1347389 RepID=A0A4R8TGJ2_9PEZI|nr:hypothetical protein C8034_v000603 [Colletotrichum sidae]
MAVAAGLPLRKLDHNFNNAEGSILSFDQMQGLTMANPLWREFVGNRMALEKRYGELLCAYESAFVGYFGGYFPIDYRPSARDTMSPDTMVKLVVTLAELSPSEPSDASESPCTDEGDVLRRLGWEDVQARKPCWALLADTYAAVPASKGTLGKPTPRFSNYQNPHGRDPILIHTNGVSDGELADQVYEAREKGCIGIIVEIVEHQFSGRVLDPDVLRRLAAREEYVDAATPDVVFFGKATGAQGTAVTFGGQLLGRLGIAGSSRGGAVRRWQAQFHKPLPTADLVRATAALEGAVGGDFAVLSRVVGRAVRAYVLERTGANGHAVRPRDVLGGLGCLIFVRKDIAGELLVMGARTAGLWIPWVKWLPRLESDMSRSKVLEEVIGRSSRPAREELSRLLVQRGSKPSWCFWCGGRTTTRKDDWS